LSGTTQVSRYQKSKTNLDFTEARDSEWQWHQLGHMQVCTSFQTDNRASTRTVFYRPFLLPNQQCQQSSQNLLPSLSVRYARRLNPLKCAYFDHLQAAVILNCLYSQ